MSSIKILKEENMNIMENNSISEIKMIDLLDRELNVGDYVAYATSCTSTGYLRRGIITKIYKSKRYYDNSIVYHIQLKSINISNKTIWPVDENGRRIYDYSKITYKTVAKVGCTSMSLQPDKINKLRVIKLGTYEDAFTSEERETISNHKYLITNYVK